MYFLLDENKRMLSFDDNIFTLNENETMIETDSFADSNIIHPKWDEKEEQWVESITEEELKELEEVQKDPVSITDTVNFLAMQIAELQTGGMN